LVLSLFITEVPLRTTAAAFAEGGAGRGAAGSGDAAGDVATAEAIDPASTLT
jgi:hypothetical protein